MATCKQQTFIFGALECLTLVCLTVAAGPMTSYNVQKRQYTTDCPTSISYYSTSEGICRCYDTTLVYDNVAGTCVTPQASCPDGTFTAAIGCLCMDATLTYSATLDMCVQVGACPTGAFTLGTSCICVDPNQAYTASSNQCEYSTTTSQTTQTCAYGQFYDTINRVCLYLPLSSQCPYNAPYDPVLGCRCPSGQAYNGMTRQCQQTSGTTACLSGQYFDVINYMCLYLPASSQCPYNAPYDVTVGCRCPASQAYNGLTGRCEILVSCPDTSTPEGATCRCNDPNYGYDPLRNVCIPRQSCPLGVAVADDIRGCRCNDANQRYDNVLNACVYA